MKETKSDHYLTPCVKYIPRRLQLLNYLNSTFYISLNMEFFFFSKTALQHLSAFVVPLCLEFSKSKLLLLSSKLSLKAQATYTFTLIFSLISALD